MKTGIVTKMSKLSEKLQVENAPRDTAEQKRTVRIVKSGAFLRAYDRSAWLLKRYGSPLNAGLDTGDSDAHVFVGFPVASIEKFTPEGCETKKDGEGIPEDWIFPATKFPHTTEGRLRIVGRALRHRNSRSSYLIDLKDTRQVSRGISAVSQ